MSTPHEAKVEKFYSSGLTGYHDYHGGFLSFGYWTRPGMSYIEAAHNLIDLLLKKLGLTNESDLLDIGCGMGSQDIYIAKKTRPRSIAAIDTTRIHIEIAKERAKNSGVSEKDITFLYGTAVRMPFPDASFSHILSIEALEHLDTREAFFREAFRVMKPGGIMAMSDYSLGRTPKNVFERAMLGLVAWLWRVPPANLYSNNEYEKKMEEAGFSNITIENVGKDVIPGYYYEHRKPAQKAAIRKVRGFWAGIVGGFIIDRGVFELYKSGLCEYIIVRAEKPNSQP